MSATNGCLRKRSLVACIFDSPGRRLRLSFVCFVLPRTKAVLRRMISRQPGLLSLSLSEDLLQKTDFFLEELGLSKNQLAKMIGAHPQVRKLLTCAWFVACITCNLFCQIRRCVTFVRSASFRNFRLCSTIDLLRSLLNANGARGRNDSTRQQVR